MKKALCLGAGGFICSHMAKRLKQDGYYVMGVDMKYPEFSETWCDEFIIGDLRDTGFVNRIFYPKYDLVVQMAADMGGALWVFTGEHDADIMHNSAMINLNVAEVAAKHKIGKLLYSSSACIYPQNIQDTPNNHGLKEYEAYPVNCDSEYGYEKIFSERLYLAYKRNYNLDVRIVRFHNVFGEEGTYIGDRTKAPAALAKKVVDAKEGTYIEVFGDGLQTRSFLHISEAIEGCMRVLESDYSEPINVGSSEMISINDLAKMIIETSGKDLSIKNIPSNALGVRGRNSNNKLIEKITGWKPSQPLKTGIQQLYLWVSNQINS